MGRGKEKPSVLCHKTPPNMAPYNNDTKICKSNTKRHRKLKIPEKWDQKKVCWNYQSREKPKNIYIYICISYIVYNTIYPRFYWTYRVYRRKYIKRHNFAALLWTWFLRKMFSEVSSERVRILIIRDFCATSWKCCSIFFSVLGIFNVKVAAEFSRDLVNNTTSTTFTSVCTPTV